MFASLSKGGLAGASRSMALPGAILLLVVLMVVPIPAALLDVFFIANIMLSLAVLMVALNAQKPLDFSSFPTVLLFVTLFRLGLNVASTRVVLVHGHEGEAAAGHVIEAFGTFLIGGDYVVGILVFAILMIINMIVVTKGAGRVSEVNARFTLDAMPGKQMSIDADLNAGVIDQETAKKRREELAQESDFFGSMDGASKFVRGDAVAGLVITAINIVGGILIGIINHQMPAGEAASTYIQLTVGDGLVTQIPALIISIAAGFLVSKAGVDGSADKALTAQLAQNPVVLGMVSAAAGVLALVPGMPILPLAGISLGAGFMAWRIGRKMLEPVVADLPPPEPLIQEDEPISATLAIDDVKIELGLGLLGLINDLDGRKLTDQIKALRRTLAQEYGFVMPSVRILDNMRLPHQGYVVRVKEMEAGSGEVRIGSLMAMDPSGRQVELPGEHMKEPAFGLPATWIDQALREEATFLGYTIVDPATVITTHLTEILKDNMSDLLSYAELTKLLKDAPDDQKKLIDDLIPSVVPVATLQRVLQALLKERVSIRDLPAILEGLGEAAPYTKSVTQLVEHVRSGLGRQLCWHNRGDDGTLPIVTLSHEWENAFSTSLVGTGEERQLTMAPSILQDFIRGVRDTFERVSMNGEVAVLLTSPQIRPYVRSIVERFRPTTTVMSQNEIHPKVKLKTVGQI